MEKRFFNHLNQEFTNDATEFKHGAWFIRMGFSGFNSRKNNYSGYASQKAAEAAILRYQQA